MFRLKVLLQLIVLTAINVCIATDLLFVCYSLRYHNTSKELGVSKIPNGQVR